MICESIQGELVAYRDGELPAQDQERIAEHLQTCMSCTRAEAQLARVEQLLATMERITPSPDFAATFWKRIEQEKAQPKAKHLNPIPEQEHPLIRWWREVRETLNNWQVAPALAAAASLLVFFGYFFTSTSPTPQTVTETPAPVLTPAPQKLVAAAPPKAASPEVPADVVEKLAFYVNYGIISNLDEFSHLEEIAAIELPPENATEVAKEDELPSELLQNPSFFAHYPILQEMDKLQNLETVLDTPTTEGDSRG